MKAKLKQNDVGFVNHQFILLLLLDFVPIIVLLQDTDPGRRLGAGPGGYPALKMHPFFKGIEWSKLRELSAPKIALDSNVLV